MSARDVLLHFAQFKDRVTLWEWQVLDRETIRNHLFRDHRFSDNPGGEYVDDHWVVGPATPASELLAIHRELHVMEFQIEKGKP